MEKQKNIPALRFPEFGGEWVEKKLGDVTRYTKGYAFKSGDYSNCGERIIRVSDLGANSIRYENEKIFIDKQKVTTLFNYKIDKGDIIITTVGSKPELLESAVGRGIFINKSSEGYLNQNLLKINQSRDVDNRFIFGYINSKKYTTHIKQIQRGNANQSNVTVADLFKFEVKIPIILEQRRISNFLTAIDEKLQALKKKKALLEQYKKGVMQKIFSQELRFKDENGNDFADWEVKKLGEIGETYGGLSGKVKENFGRGKPYIQYKQIFDDSKIDISRFEFVEVGVSENQNKALFGDVFFTISSETPNEIGTSSVLLDKVEELYLNSFCFGYRANSLEELSPYFSRYLFKTESFRNNIVKLAQGSTRYNMSKSQLMKLEILLPTILEQQKIANFLTAIDEKINQQQSQIEKVSHYKKGLLQQMFC